MYRGVLLTHYHYLLSYKFQSETFDLSHLSPVQSDDSQTGKKGNLNLVFYCQFHS